MTSITAHRLIHLRRLLLKYSLLSNVQFCRKVSVYSSTDIQFRLRISRWPPQALPSLQSNWLFTSSKNNISEPKDLDIVCRSAFFGCVSQKMSEDVLEEYFSSYGTVENLYLIRNFRRQSKGYGVVVFRDPETVDAVLDGTHKIDGSIFKAERSRKYRVLMVEGVPHSYSEEAVRELFSHFGEVGKIQMHKPLDRTRRYCLVSFAKQTDALEAVRNANNLGGKDFTVGLTLLNSMKDYTRLPSRRVIVYNLPYATRVDELYKHFKFPCATLREIHLRLDSENKTCLAFLQFDDAEESEKLIKEGTTPFGGQNVSLKKIDDSQPLNSTDSALFLENIPHELSRDHIYHHFKNFGRIEKCQVKQNRGFGWVRYFIGPDAMVASREREHVINGHTIYARRLALKIPENGL